jgi:hypothetical protein
MPGQCTILIAVGYATLAATTVAGQQQPKLDCDTDVELQSNFLYVQRVCNQTGEHFVDALTPIPTTCTTLGCKRAIMRVSGDCGTLLGSSVWYATAKKMLDDVAIKCDSLPAPHAGRVYALSSALRSPASQGTHAITDCQGVLTDGEGNYGNDWKRLATIDAGPGKKVRVTFEVLDLAEGDLVSLYDGAGVPEPAHEQDALIDTLRGRTLPARAITSNGQFMTVKMLTNHHSVATGFQLSITCECVDSSEWVDGSGQSCTSYSRGEPRCEPRTLAPPPPICRLAGMSLCDACSEIDWCHGPGQLCQVHRRARPVACRRGDTARELDAECAGGLPAELRRLPSRPVRLLALRARRGLHRHDLRCAVRHCGAIPAVVQPHQCSMLR